MPIIDTSPELAQQLGKLSLPEAAGSFVMVKSLFAKKPLVLVHLRHFGCLFCRAQVQELSARQKEFEEQGATIAVIGTGDLAYAKDFKTKFSVAFPVLVDTELTSYTLARCGTSSQLNWASPSVISAAVTAVRMGSMQGKLGSHIEVLGAAHVILPDGTIPFAWVNKDFGDNVPVEYLFSAIAR